MGLDPEKFWTMIPSEFIVFVRGRVKAIKDEDERENHRIARLSYVIATFAPVKKSRRFKISDFLPKKKQTNEDMLREVEKLNRMFGGEDRRKK